MQLLLINNMTNAAGNDTCYEIYIYTGMDKTSLDTSSGTLFVRDSLRMSTSRRT